jgi:hypothetical protein
VILAKTRDASAARAFASRVRASGRSAGVLDSDNYSSLQGGYSVVFSGRYTTRTAAIAQAETLRRTYDGAYAQRIAE